MLYASIGRRADALSERADAIPTTGQVHSPSHLSFAPFYRRGRCSLHAALWRGRIGAEELGELLAVRPLADNLPRTVPRSTWRTLRPGPVKLATPRRAREDIATRGGSFDLRPDRRLRGRLLGGAARRPRLGAALLVCVPLVDLILLVASALDLRYGGARSTSRTGWPRSTSGSPWRGGVRWCPGPTPASPPRSGGPTARTAAQDRPEHARRERRRWGRHLLAWAVGCALLVGGVALVVDPDRTAALTGIASKWTLVLAVDFLWPFNYTLWPRKKKPCMRRGFDANASAGGLH